MNYPYSVGNRVLWLNPESQEEIKGTITRLWKTKAEITDRNFQKHKVDLDDIELAPVVAKSPPHPTPHTLPTIPHGDRPEFRVQSEAETPSECTLNEEECNHEGALVPSDSGLVYICWKCFQEVTPPVQVLKAKMDSLLQTQLSVEEKMRARGDSERDIAEASFMYEEQIDWIRGEFKKLGDIRVQSEAEKPSECTLNSGRSPEPVTSKQPSVISPQPSRKKAGKPTREEQEKIAGEICVTRGVHYEWKMINGCGAYLYVRWWEDGKHKSTTLNSYLKKHALS